MLSRFVIIACFITAIISEILGNRNQVVCGGVVHTEIVDVLKAADGIWYDENNCLSYQCIISDGELTLAKRSCEDVVFPKGDPKCKWLKGGTALYPLCCYGTFECEE